MGKFDKYDGIVKFDFNGEPYAVQFKVEDAKEFVKAASEFKRTKNLDEEQKFAYWLRILKRSYPESSDVEITNFLAIHILQFEKAFMIAAGMVDAEKLKRMEDTMEKDFTKLMGELLS